MLSDAFKKVDRASTLVSSYNVTHNLWSHETLRSFPAPARIDAAAVEWNSVVYVIGGQTTADTNRSRTSTVACFNISANRWNTSVMPFLRVARSRHAACVLTAERTVSDAPTPTDTTTTKTAESGGSTQTQSSARTTTTTVKRTRRLEWLCVSGGIGSEVRHETSCEMFDLKTGEKSGQIWSDLPPMKYRRAQHAMVCLDGCLYVIGNGGSSAIPIERFCPFDYSWSAFRCPIEGVVFAAVPPPPPALI